MLRGEHCIQHSLFCLCPLSIRSMEHKGRKRKKKKGKKQWSRAYCNFTGLDRQKMEFKLQRNQDLRSKILRKKEPQGGEADMKPEFTQVIL